MRELTAAECGFGYRRSMFKYRDRCVVLAVTFRLRESALPARALRGARARARRRRRRHARRSPTVREAVLALRRGKGMVVDPADPDSRQRGLVLHQPDPGGRGFAPPARARRAEPQPPAFPEPDGRVKTSAAWLIERAGFARGLRHGRVGISTKHTLALVNRGGATTRELLALAREIAGRRARALRRRARPEPVLVGHDW